MAAGVKFGGYPNKQAQLDAIAKGEPERLDGKVLQSGILDPNLRDEGAGFFSTLYTAGSNIGTDALQEIAYIAQAVARPIDTGEAILRVVAGYAQKGLPDSWEAYLPEDWQTNKMYANAINDYYAEKYGSLEQAADSFAEKPVSVALDVFAVKAVISAVARQAAKKAAVTTKLATTAEGTVLQGELAARAAAESAIAKETAGTVERVVKHEGKLVFDRELGAYVPESSVGQAARSADDIAIAQETAAPIIADVVEKTPTIKPAVLADDVAAVSVNQADGVALREAVKEAKKNERKVDDALQDVHANEGEIAGEAFYLSDVIPAKAALIDAEIAELAIDGSIGAQRLIREAKIRKIALEQDIRNVEATTIYNASLSDAELAAQVKLYPLIDDATAANMVRNGMDEAAVARNQSLAAAMEEALAARTANRTTAIDSTGNRGADGSFVSVLESDNWLPSNSTSAARLERTREIETMLNEYTKADAQGVLSATDKAAEASLIRELTHYNDVENFARVVKEAGLDDLGSIVGDIRKSVDDVKAVTATDLAGSRAADGSLKVATQADAAKLLRDETAMRDIYPARSPIEEAEKAFGNEMKGVEPLAFMDGTAQESLAATKAYNEARIAEGKMPVSRKGSTVSIADDLEQAAASRLLANNKMVAERETANKIAAMHKKMELEDAKAVVEKAIPASAGIEAQIAKVELELAEYKSLSVEAWAQKGNTKSVNAQPYLGDLIATKTNELKLLRDEKAMADAIKKDSSPGAEQFRQQALDEASEYRALEDAKMAAATQTELFSSGSAAAYEQAQAARIANEVTRGTELAKTATASKGMMATTPESRLAKYTRDERKFVDDTPVSRFTPVSVPKTPYSSTRGWKKPEIDDYKAAALVGQRISSATQANTELPAFDNEQFDIPILGNDVVTNPDYTKPEAPIVPEVKVQELRPGWRQGNTYENDDGNFWSADFDHEHWNTPAGVNEAISIWGRPMGSRHSWETPAAIKSQYTNRQPADWSWMDRITRNRR